VQLTPVIAFLLIGLVYYLGIRTERTGFVAEVLDPNLKRITQPVLNAFRGRPPSVNRMVVRMTQQRMDSLLDVRERALEQGWLHPEENPRFPVGCAFGEYEFAGSLNLLDGPAEQHALRRWPFQLRIQDGDTLFGMQTFDLAPVHDIRSVHSWIMQATLADQGMLHYGHAMLELRMNGVDLGLYTMEGRTDSTVLELWGRGPGPVMRFDDALLAGTRAAMENRLYGSMPPPQGDWLAAPIIASRNIGMNDAAALQRFQQAVQQLEAFRAGRLVPSEIFDIPSLSRLYALADLLGGQEAVAWWNMRFLADTLTDRLMAIPQKGHAGSAIQALSALHLQQTLTFRPEAAGFQDRFFNDSIFYRSYLAHLDTFTRPGWLEGLLERLSPEMNDRLRIIAAEYPNEMLDTNVFRHNRVVIEQTLRPRDLLLAYTQSVQGNQRRLALANVHALPIRAVAVVQGTDTIPLARPVTLLPRELDKPLTYTVVNTRLPSSEGRPERILVQVLGLPELRSTTIRTWSTFVAQ
jgi:hypothetical protein